MPKKNKMKTHKGTKKVLKIHPSGTITIGRPGSRHNTGKKSTNSNRKNRAGSVLSNSDYKRIKTII
ncbi:MAG: 50S ribosomal protein L35 [Bacilli bacterium]|nr:50S ribosomal protein L35 [Bacilli bacterium]